MGRGSFCAVLVAMLVLSWSFPDAACPQPWSDLTVRSLPDTSFALVETDKKGRKVRHCPYRDMNGFVDINQLIYCLGTFSQESWLEPGHQEVARKRLEEHYQRLRLKQEKEEIAGPVNINKADLEALVRLPGIGPVSAVRMHAFRKTHGPFQHIEDVKQVPGIGASTFAGIRHYIVVKD
ncbi:MAG: helix-hairpin-helix domain-containing protein [Thermodesulfobacteriota bacterium]|nr:helix-hairpin-helix domain-containing protein [Thermodesulfobacteriota bacterium]